MITHTDHSRGDVKHSDYHLKTKASHAKRILFISVWTLSLLLSPTPGAFAEDTQPQGGKQLISLTKVAPDLTPVSDYTGDFWDRSTLFGDVGGKRQQLYEKGITLDATLTQVYQGVVSGGKDDGASEYYGLLEYGMTLDTGKLGWWSGGLFVANGYTNFGNLLLSDVGNLSPVNYNSILPTPDPSETFLMEYYLTQALSKKTILTVGRLNAANFLDKTRYGNDRRTQFLNASMDNNLLLGEFVTFSTYAALLAHKVNKNVGVFAAVFDPNTTPPDYDANNGLFDEVGVGGGAEFEWELSGGRDGTFTPLFIYSTADTLDIGNPHFVRDVITGNLPEKSDNWIFIATFDQALWNPESAGKRERSFTRTNVSTAAFDYEKRGIGVFFRFAYAPEDRNPFNVFVSGGIGGRGVFSSRPHDRFGIGAYGLFESTDLDALPGNLLDDENGFEAFYNFALTPAIQLSFDVQWINPVVTRTDDAVVLGTRLFMRF
jgi:porin